MNAVVTGGYWAFTITDESIRMLVVLYFHLLGYSPFEVAMLSVPDSWLSIAYVMAAQALSGIAKDLNKMSVKAIVTEGSGSSLFKWVAILTGSKNALKGAGFFVGAALLEWAGFRAALAILAGTLAVVLVVTAVLLPSGLGKMKARPKFTQVFSRVSAINWLSVARFFLFGSRDVWFVVALPVFLYEVLGCPLPRPGLSSPCG